jgi:hypothetical protein
MFPSVFLSWCSSIRETAMEETVPSELSTVATRRGKYITDHQGQGQDASEKGRGSAKQGEV